MVPQLHEPLKKIQSNIGPPALSGTCCLTPEVRAKALAMAVRRAESSRLGVESAGLEIPAEKESVIWSTFPSKASFPVTSWAAYAFLEMTVITWGALRKALSGLKQLRKLLKGIT